MNRHQAREKAFEILFQLDLNKNDPQTLISELEQNNQINAFGLGLVNGVIDYKENIDSIMKNNLKGWSLGRIAAVERSVLRMAIYEYTYASDIPRGVTINEAIEIAKKFGSEQSGKFVNGVLANIIQ